MKGRGSVREKRGVGARPLPVAIAFGHMTWEDAASISIMLTWAGQPEAYNEPNI